MLEHKDYISSLNKARKKRNQNIDPRYLLILLAAVIVVGIIVLGVKAAMKEPASGRASGNRPVQEAGAATARRAEQPHAQSADDLPRRPASLRRRRKQPERKRRRYKRPLTPIPTWVSCRYPDI